MRYRCFTLLFLLLLFGCRRESLPRIIDYIKVSDSTYLSVSEMTTDLEVPWDMQYNPHTNSIFFTQIKGLISELNIETGETNTFYNVPNVYHERSSGLLGLAIDPNFEMNPFIYICHTTRDQDSIYSELRKLEVSNKKEVISNQLLLKIEGGTGHNGARLVFGNDGCLYWATGDVHSLTHAQDSTSLNGKVLRINTDGSIPADNPIKNSYVYAWGFRNIQGMTFSSNANLFTSEHGDAIADEVNWVRPLHNYGWMQIEGYHDTPEEKAIAANNPRTEPIREWTPVIAPSALQYYSSTQIPEWRNSLLLGTLKNQSFRVLKLNTEQTQIDEEEIFLKDKYGRIRAITVDNIGNIYIATSNKDWNPQKGFPLKSDDRILKLSRTETKPTGYLEKYIQTPRALVDGKTLYQSYCSSCHKEDGLGINGTFPALKKSNVVADKDKLVLTVLNGTNLGKDLPMPAFGFLNDIEIAKIVSYVRENFENNYSAIDEEYIANKRNK